MKNEALEWQSINHMIKRMEYEDEREKLKHAKMKKLDQEGLDVYDEDEMDVSEDEFADED